MYKWLLAQSLALTALMCWPMPTVLATQAIGHPEGDGPKHLWTLWWMRHGELGHTRWVNFPEGMPLYPIEPLNGLLALVLPLDVIGLSNVLALLHLTLLGLCAGWLGWLVSGTRAGMHAAAALAQGSSFAAFTLQVGVGELRQVWWIPLGLALLVRAQQSGAWGWYLALGASLAGATVACFYHGFFLAIGVSLVALAGLRRAQLPRLAAAAGLALALTLPALSHFGAGWGGGAEPEPLISGGRISRDYALEAMQAQQLVLPSAPAPTPQQEAYDGGRYLGWGTLVLAGLGAWAGRRRALPWALVAGVGVTLSFGTVLYAWDAPVLLGGKRLLMPLAAFYDLLARVAEPPNFPARFVVLASVALAVLASMAPARTLWLVPFALVDMHVNDLVGWPRPHFTLADVAGLGRLAGEGAVADLSFVASPDRPARARAIAAQIEMDRPTQAVPIERVETWATSGMYWTYGLTISKAIARVHEAEPVEVDARGDLWLLRDRGFDRVLLTWSARGWDQAQVDVLRKALGEPAGTARQGMVWVIPEIEATEAEKAAWRERGARVTGRDLHAP